MSVRTEDETLRVQSAEADCFRRLYGMSFEDSCALAGVDPDDYQSGGRIVHWLPLPSHIATAARNFLKSAPRPPA